MKSRNHMGKQIKNNLFFSFEILHLCFSKGRLKFQLIKANTLKMEIISTLNKETEKICKD